MSSHCNNNNSFYPYPTKKTSYYDYCTQPYVASCPSAPPMYHPPYYPPPYYAYPPYPPPYYPHPHPHPHSHPHSHPHHDPYYTGDILNSNTDDPFSPPDYDKHLYDNNHDHCSIDYDQATIESQVCDSIPLPSNNNDHQNDNESHNHQPINTNDDDLISCCTEPSIYSNSTYTSTCSTVNTHNTMVPCCNPQPKQDKFILRVPKNRRGRIYINK